MYNEYVCLPIFMYWYDYEAIIFFSNWTIEWGGQGNIAPVRKNNRHEN